MARKLSFDLDWNTKLFWKLLIVDIEFLIDLNHICLRL